MPLFKPYTRTHAPSLFENLFEDAESRKAFEDWDAARTRTAHVTEARTEGASRISELAAEMERRDEADPEEEWHRREYGECARLGRLTSMDKHPMNAGFAFLISHLQRADARVGLDDLYGVLRRWCVDRQIPHHISRHDLQMTVYRWLSAQSSLSMLVGNGSGSFLCGYAMRECPLTDEQTALYVEAVGDVTWGERIRR